MHRRCFCTVNRPLPIRPGDIRQKKKTHWTLELKAFNNVQKALNHYDDFYATVFGNQWPSMRLGLLSPPKYMAIPNSFTGNIDKISERLQEMGAFRVPDLWRRHQELLVKMKKEIDLKSDLGRLHKLEKTLESIAATKRAEELDVLYQNAPTSKREEIKLSKRSPSRIISGIGEAASDFIPSTKLKGVEDFTFDSEYFTSYLRNFDNPDSDDYGLHKDNEDDEVDIQFLKSPISNLEIPKVLVPHSFENGSALMFPPSPRDSASDLREFICVNGSSILPIIALDLRPETTMLDLCAGPGTKSLLSLMTMTLSSLTCNDVEDTRLNRVKRIMEEFTGTRNPPSVIYTKFNARDYPANNEFSRVLVDVPCLNDRVSCTVVDNNIFKAKRTKERLNLVRTQREILLSGLKAVDKNEGSVVVYSTCTLSPIENDGVVMNALKETEVPNLHIDLIGLVKLAHAFERGGVFRITRTRCGILVIPNTFCNFGPMYVSRIVVKHPVINTDTPTATETVLT